VTGSEVCEQQALAGEKPQQVLEVIGVSPDRVRRLAGVRHKAQEGVDQLDAVPVLVD
jgi:hypothetical protein